MALQQRTVLIVDDFPQDREIYRRYLQKDPDFAYTILESESGLAGLALCQTQKIDGILLDFWLPDLDGLKFLAQLKAQTNDNFPPVVVITGHGNEAIAVQVIKSGAEDYLVKERTTPDSLRQAMRCAIENAELRQQLQQSEKLFHTSVENMLDCFGIYSAIRDESGIIIDFRVDYVNAAACKSNQMTKEQQIGFRLCELLPVHRSSGLFEEYCQVVETGETLVKESLIYSDVYDQQHLTKAFDIRITKLGDGFVAAWRDITEKKQVEVALFESEQRYRSLVTVTCSIVFLAQANGAIVSAPEWETFTGQTPEQYTGWGWVDAVHPDDRQPTAEIWTRALQEKKPCEAEYRLLHRDGNYRYVYVRGVPILDATDNVREWIGTVTDITERKQAQSALRRSEELLSLALDSANMTAFTWDILTDQVYRSRSVGETPGLGFNIPVGRFNDKLNMVHPDDRSGFLADLQTALSSEKDYESEHRMLQPDGSVWWVLDKGRITFDESGRAVRLSGVAFDITERKQKEAALQIQACVLENMAEGVVMADENGIIALTNPAFDRMFGYERGELLGQPVQVLNDLPPSENDQFISTLLATLKSHGTWSGEVNNRKKDGTSFITYVCINALNINHKTHLIAVQQDITSRKIAESALRQSEETALRQLAELEAIYATAPIGLSFHDAGLRFVRINERLAQINGLPVSEHIGRTIHEVIPELVEKLEPIFQQVLQSGLPLLNLEIHTATPGLPDVERDFLTSYYPLKAADGQLLGINVMVQDITERKQVEAALSQSEERYRQLVELCPDGIFIQSEGKFVFVNQAALTFFGADSPEQLLGKSVLEFIHPEYREIVRTRIQQLKENQAVGLIEEKLFRLDGRIVDGEIAAIPLIYQGQPAAQAVIRDISARKQAESALKQSEALFRGVFESDLIGILFWNTEGQITDANDAFLRMTGYSREEIHAGELYYHNITPPEYHELDAQKFQILQTTGKYSPVEKEYICKDGSRIPILLGCAFLPGTRDRGVAFVLDISDRKQWEQEREQLLVRERIAREEAEAANRSKDEFVAVVAHELRSPLNSILGWAKLLLPSQV